MDIKERAKVIAFARLLGVTGSDKEIFDKFWNYYESALKSLSEPATPSKVEVFRSPI